MSAPAEPHTHEHRHGSLVHSHAHVHVLGVDHHDPRAHDHHHRHEHGHDDRSHDHGHSHALVDRSILRSHDGVRTVAISLAVLAATALLQAAVFALSGSVALLADTIHNFGDALTAVPLGIAFVLRSARGERWAGMVVVLAILVSACFALYETVERFLHPQHLSHLGVLAAAGVAGFLGNEIAARVRLMGGRRIQSPALIADGNHARVDGFVSLGVVASAACVWAGAQIVDPLIGLTITLVILRVTWVSWKVVSAAPAPAPHGR
jgi:divalent metal cation (Fe/Co/Zn/Cd) transporter